MSSSGSQSNKISNEELNKLILIAQQLEQQRSAYQQQIDLLNGYYTDIITAEQTLVELKSCKKAHKVLFPIGAGIFVYANVEESDNVLVSVGARVHVKKPLDDAIAIIKKRKEEIENQLTNTKARYNEVIERLKEIDAILQNVQ